MTKNEDGKKATQVLVACMDYRLNWPIDAMRHSHEFEGLALRNAGANVSGLRDSLNHILNSEDIREIVIMTHNNCAAMGIVFGAIKEKKPVDGSIMERLVKPFEALKGRFSTIEELERLNTEMQVGEINDMLQKRGDTQVKVTVRFVDVHNLPKDQTVPAEVYEKRVIVIKPSIRSYADIIGNETSFKNYVLQSVFSSEVFTDIKAAASLGISQFDIIPLRRSEERDSSHTEKMTALTLASFPAAASIPQERKPTARRLPLR